MMHFIQICKVCFGFIILFFLYINTSFASDVQDFQLLKKITVTNSERDEIKFGAYNNLTNIECKNSYKLAIFIPGYLEEFNEILIGIFQELDEYGLAEFSMDKFENIDFYSQTFIDKFLNDNKNSCISIVSDGIYTADFNQEKRTFIKQEILNRIKNKEITMLLGLGTISGLDYADSSLGIPVIIADSANPDKVGIMDPQEFSTKPNVFVQWAPKYAEHNINVYHLLFNFKSLGMLLDVNKDIMEMQSYGVVNKQSKEHNFTVHPCHGRLVDSSKDELYEDVSKCVAQFVDQNLDAVYLPIYSGLDPKDVDDMIDPLIQQGIKVFTDNIEYVEYGALLSIFQSNMRDSGLFTGRVISRIANGEKIEKISQVYIPDFMFSLNLNTARTVKWAPSFEFLMQVEYLYDK